MIANLHLCFTICIKNFSAHFLWHTYKICTSCQSYFYIHNMIYNFFIESQIIVLLLVAFLIIFLIFNYKKGPKLNEFLCGKFGNKQCSEFLDSNKPLKVWDVKVIKLQLDKICYIYIIQNNVSFSIKMFLYDLRENLKANFNIGFESSLAQNFVFFFS